jgi:hypothetical protein
MFNSFGLKNPSASPSYVLPIKHEHDQHMTSKIKPLKAYPYSMNGQR